MRQTKLFNKTTKEIPTDETSRNAELLIRGGFIDKLMAGVYNFLPLGLRVIKKIEQIIREEMTAIDGQEVFLPALQPKENWQKTGRWETMDDLYKLKLENKEYALGPTHEEVVAPLVRKFISSYKDLPVNLFQFQNKFRHEKRAKSGLLRGREFLMKDLYSFNKDEKELDDYYEKAKEAYWKIFKRCGLSEKTYLTYASGGTFSQYFHEFQTLTEAGEDLIYVCEKCQVAVNKEIITDNKKCPECGNDKLEEKKAVEVGNIFKLKNKFSQPFGLIYTDEKGTSKEVVMGCYGIGLQRVMGTIVEIYNDEKGIIWPENVAPFKVHLIEINSDKKEVRQTAKKLYNDLNSKNIEVLYDDRQEISAGQKFAEADLIGCPYRIVVSEKTIAENKFELKERNKKDVKMVAEKELVELLGYGK